MGLRLGVNCAVIDDAGGILLSRRSDLNIWNLPGGRLDHGETFQEATAREVNEETGIVVHIERAVGLYYWQGWRRLNVLYAGWPLGGKLKQQTPECRANQFFMPDALPPTPWAIMALDALAQTRHKPRIIHLSQTEQRMMRLKLRWRWLYNLLTRNPEPRFPQFEVHAVGVIWDESYRRVMTVPDVREYALPRVRCDGDYPPWHQLADAIHLACGIRAGFRWVGLWQDVPTNKIELIFAATVEETALAGTAKWSIAQNAPLNNRDTDYVEHVRPDYAREPVWTTVHNTEIEHGEILNLKGEEI